MNIKIISKNSTKIIFGQYNLSDFQLKYILVIIPTWDGISFGNFDQVEIGKRNLGKRFVTSCLNCQNEQ